ncbi:MAG: beta-ketoacyl-ACP synthase III [Micavibrio aeruginosavorus]|uniref:Beta-ketoacyl-ACP synthase III n=1 Tax=Micavibrio aeruginosavorus TaxID=349221 RepID=A0A7T5R112_9BACT|nr:MAG: beta-ketoacyl-ACP synthase III [Micavibrio aeruginosavorus]
MAGIVVSGTGLYTPPHSISNEELVVSFNNYVERYNAEHAAAIANGDVEALLPSSVEFIVKASGIQARYVVEKEGILNPEIMAPRIPERANDEISILAEMAVVAAREAMTHACKAASDIDAVIVACSNSQRPYPAVAIEVQNALGIEGFGFDMNVACSSATFGIQVAADMIAAGHARAILIVNPEICSGHLNFRNRNSHFIFGDVATAIILEKKETCVSGDAFEIVGTKLQTKFSNNIRNNFGFLNNAAPEGIGKPDKLFMQEGLKVFKEVVPMVSDMILEHLRALNIPGDSLRRLWLHQANIHMNEMIGRKVLGRTPEEGESPVILDEYANTSSAGSIIAFHKYHQDMKAGDLGIICSFGAGYSAGSVVLRKL